MFSNQNLHMMSFAHHFDDVEQTNVVPIKITFLTSIKDKSICSESLYSVYLFFDSLNISKLKVQIFFASR